MNKIREVLQTKKVGIIGVGGLGSHVILSLVRAGVGSIIYADFDIVSADNLNRQAYFNSDIGCHKVDAIYSQLKAINSTIQLTKIKQKITSNNLCQYFKDVDILLECVDTASSKAEIVETTLTKTNLTIISASGIAGIKPCHLIKTQKINERFYLVGDQVSSASKENPLVAPRVLVAAGQQACKAIEILLNREEI